MYKCPQETHDKCENSSLCHLCDGVRLYKNTREEIIRKEENRKRKKEEERHAAFRTYKAEKKEGMAFEKAVAKKWNDAYKKKEDTSPAFRQSTKKTKIQKPRIQVEPSESIEEKAPEPQNYTPNISVSTLGSTNPPKKKQRPIVDARRQANSGAMWHSKGDIKTKDYLLECKERGTVNARGEKTISIPKEWLTKQEQEAFQENRPYWAIPFRYKNDDQIYLVKSFDQELELYQELLSLKEQLAELKDS